MGPCRYYITKDNRLILASEAGVLGVKDEDVVEKGRLSPGKMLWVDFAQNRVQRDSELKDSMAKAKPYGKWLGEGTSMQDLMNDGEILEDTPDVETRGVRLLCIGYQQESLALILGPMAMNGEESLCCMGNDTLLAALSDLLRSSFDFFYQLFARVTNPPTDPIREFVVMSLCCWVGPEENLLGEPTPDHCRRLWLDHPCLNPRQFSSFSKTTKIKGWSSQTVDNTFPKREGSRGLEMNLSRICQEVINAVDAGCQVFVLSGVVYLGDCHGVFIGRSIFPLG